MNRHQYQTKIESYTKAHMVCPIAFEKPEDQLNSMKVVEKSEEHVPSLEESGKHSEVISH